jgi:hypothetical protein
VQDPWDDTLIKTGGMVKKDEKAHENGMGIGSCEFFSA